MSSPFELEYKKLNIAQKQAVDAIDGPVMVVAGPGTGKTQVLALRIANILKKTDTGASGILCLTFTNSGVRAMRARLAKIIGGDAANVRISTFHSFALDLVEKNYALLDFDQMPELLDESTAIGIFDDLLENNDWEYLRPRGNSTQYFYDVKSLIGLLKRERIAPGEFLRLINKQIEDLTLDPGSVSSRGETKGELKKEIIKKIESLKRTSEVVRFYEMYESYKIDNSYIDYDDVLKLMVELVKNGEDVGAEIRENFLYVLVDEHQDSSGVQNEFLQYVWQDTEKPNIFVVGDDRQLIYGFGGAKLDYFENFKTIFGRAELITLTENYRSSQKILDTADELLKSTIANGKLNSNTFSGEKINLVEAPYFRDEIILAGREIKKQIDNGIEPNECAILVPKNAQVRNAITVLRDMGLPVSAGDHADLFLSKDYFVILAVLRIIEDPYNSESIAEYLLSAYSGVPVMAAHSFLRNTNSRNLSVEVLNQNKSDTNNLFGAVDPIVKVGTMLTDFVNYNSSHTVYETIQYVGEKVLLSNAKGHESLVASAEVIRTMLHLAMQLESRKDGKNIKSYLSYLYRLDQYGQHVPIAVFGVGQGVKVMTMHASKGLEFDFVWIAHMDEKSLFGSSRNAFTLPEIVENLIEEKDDLVVKRQVYVAITRAKKHCSISYAHESYTGAPLELAHILTNLAGEFFNTIGLEESEKLLMSGGVGKIVTKETVEDTPFGKTELAIVVKSEYEKAKVSVTLLNNFFECPWKWYFRNLLQLPEAKSASLVFGSVVHECLEAILKSGAKPTLKDIEKYLDTSLDKNNVFDKNEVRRIKKDALPLLLNWVEVRLAQLAKSFTSERSVSYKDPNFPHLSMYGKIDLTENLPGGELRVTDFKTGSSKTKNVIEKDGEEGRLSSFIRQLSMYTYLIRGNDKNIKVTESVLEFLEEDPKNKDYMYKTSITPEHLELLQRDIKDYDDLLSSGEWINRPCHHKSFGKETICKSCELANRIYGN